MVDRETGKIDSVEKRIQAQSEILRRYYIGAGIDPQRCIPADIILNLVQSGELSGIHSRIVQYKDGSSQNMISLPIVDGRFRKADGNSYEVDPGTLADLAAVGFRTEIYVPTREGGTSILVARNRYESR